jgi:ribosomal protein S27AE
MQHTVKILGSKAGSIGTKYNESRTYQIDDAGEGADTITFRAITEAYKDGLEHVLVTMIDGKPTRGHYSCVNCGAKHTNEFSLTCGPCDRERESGELDING